MESRILRIEWIILWSAYALKHYSLAANFQSDQSYSFLCTCFDSAVSHVIFPCTKRTGTHGICIICLFWRVINDNQNCICNVQKKRMASFFSILFQVSSFEKSAVIQLNEWLLKGTQVMVSHIFYFYNFAIDRCWHMFGC